MGTTFCSPYEGWYWPRTDHHMDIWACVKTPRNANIVDKPVADCSQTYNFTARKDAAQKWGVGFGARYMHSIAHFTAEPELVPYTHTYSSLQAANIMWVFTMSMYQGYYIAKMQLGNVYVNNPRTVWAHRVVWTMQSLRFAIAAVVGWHGYFFSYEFLYTYVPYFRIRDPSLEGWKKCWQEGQSTFLARAAACIFPFFAHWLWNGTRKRSTFYFWMALFNSWNYEAVRPVFAGNHIFYSYKGSVYAQLNSKYGSLVPDPQRRGDADTGLPERAHNYRYNRFSHGTFQEQIWENVHHDNLPLYRLGAKTPNLHFNWQKAAQTWNSSIFEVKNQLWDLPQVLTPRGMAGVLDQPRDAPVYERNANIRHHDADAADRWTTTSEIGLTPTQPVSYENPKTRISAFTGYKDTPNSWMGA